MWQGVQSEPVQALYIAVAAGCADPQLAQEEPFGTGRVHAALYDVEQGVGLAQFRQRHR